MKQALGEWNSYLHKFLPKLSCKHSRADPTLYVLKGKYHFVFLVVYVDDILILSNMQEKVIEMVVRFSKQVESGIRRQ